MGNEHSYTSTVERRIAATSIIRSPRNYGQFFRFGKTTMDFVIKNPLLMRSPVNTATATF